MKSTAHDRWLYITVIFAYNVEFQKAENDGVKGQHPCEEIHDKGPSPWPPSRVHFPLEIKSSNVFPSILEVSPRYFSRRRRTEQLTCTPPQICASFSLHGLARISQLTLLREGDRHGTNHASPTRMPQRIPLSTMRHSGYSRSMKEVEPSVSALAMF
jgi:hypothetical protein